MVVDLLEAENVVVHRILEFLSQCLFQLRVVVLDLIEPGLVGPEGIVHQNNLILERFRQVFDLFLLVRILVAQFEFPGPWLKGHKTEEFDPLTLLLLLVCLSLVLFFLVENYIVPQS